MADHLDVAPEVLRGIAAGFDDRSREVDELTLPAGVDGGLASADILLLVAEVSADLGQLAGGLEAMSRKVLDSRQLYLDSDAAAAEALFLAGGGR